MSRGSRNLDQAARMNWAREKRLGYCPDREARRRSDAIQAIKKQIACGIRVGGHAWGTGMISQRCIECGLGFGCVPAPLPYTEAQSRHSHQRACGERWLRGVQIGHIMAKAEPPEFRPPCMDCGWRWPVGSPRIEIARRAHANLIEAGARAAETGHGRRCPACKTLNDESWRLCGFCLHPMGRPAA